MSAWWSRGLFVVSAVMERSGLALAALGVRGDRREASELAAQASAIQAERERDPIRYTDERINAEWALLLHQNLLAFVADRLSGGIPRQFWGLVLIGTGIIVGLVGNLLVLNV